jgi:hypothetical protein
MCGKRGAQTIRNFSGRSKGIRTLSRRKLKFEDSIKKEFKDIGSEILD